MEDKDKTKEQLINELIGQRQRIAEMESLETERERVEVKIKQVTEEWETTFNSIVDLVSIQDKNFKLVKVNKAYADTFKLKPEELIGKACYEIIHGTKEPWPNCPHKKTMETKKSVKEEFFEPRLGINLEVSTSPIFDGKGKITGSVHLTKDITERKRAEETVQQQKDFSDTVIETAEVVIVGLDLEGKVILFNRKAEEVTGYSRLEVIGKDLFKTFFLVGEESVLARMFQRIVAGKTVTPRDISLITKSGGKRILYSQGTTLKDGKGKVIGVLGIGSDVTERRKMEQHLLQSEKLRSLGELAGGVAHDFNNVLAAILGNAQLIKMNIESPLGVQERRKSIQVVNKGLDIIVKAAKDGAETVKRIQEFARKRDEDKYFAQVNINELINHALEFTRTRWKDDAESKGIKINIQKEFSSLPLTAGSAAELREVFTNLINNAVDAMPQGGGIKIKTFEEDDRVCIKVEDTGAGIANDRKDRIFDPFFTTKGVKSSGLGLSVSYGIINRHRGTISVDSVEGQGTTFTVKLPISERMIEEEEVQPVSEEQKKASILVIEDEEEVRNLLYFILMRGGHQVETVSSGLQGVELFEKKKFDLVFTDLGMPGMSGWLVAEKIKSINGKVPVVLITGWDIDLKESEVSKNWVDLIIHKPFGVDQVLRSVQEGMVLREQFKV